MASQYLLFLISENGIAVKKNDAEEQCEPWKWQKSIYQEAEATIHFTERPEIEDESFSPKQKLEKYARLLTVNSQTGSNTNYTGL